MPEIKFNINDYVKVKLNDLGHRIMADNHKMIYKDYHHPPEFSPPKIDADGYCKFQCWDFMWEFGRQMMLGFEMPFDSEIIICAQEQKPNRRGTLTFPNKNLTDEFMRYYEAILPHIKVTSIKRHIVNGQSIYHCESHLFRELQENEHASNYLISLVDGELRVQENRFGD